MAYTNQQIWDYIDFLSDKDLKGNVVSPSQRNLLLKVASTEMFEQVLQDYESTQSETDTIQRFKSVKAGADLSFSNDSYGYYFTLPADYVRMGSLVYRYSGNKYDSRPFDILTDGEWNDVRGSYIKKPSREFPVATIRDGKVYYAPDANDDVAGLQTAYIEMTYLREPTEPVYAYSYDAATDEYSYNSGSSTELDWADDDKIRIAGLILSKIGVNLTEQQMLQYGQMIKQEQG
jgi:hypothetical protein